MGYMEEDYMAIDGVQMGVALDHNVLVMLHWCRVLFALARSVRMVVGDA